MLFLRSVITLSTMAETPRNSRYSNKKTDKIPGVRGVLNPEMGKLPPQALELEEAVLGAMLIEPRALNTVIDLLKPESFYKEAHTLIFECMREMFQAGTPVDILTVTQELRKLGKLDFVGGPLYISNLTNRIGSTANVEAHARVVTQKYIQRELIAASNEIIKKAYDETTDTFELLDEAEQNIFKVAEGNIRKSSDKMSTLVTTALEAIAQAAKNQDGVSGVPTGFTAVDKLTGGWQRSDMIVIAARPGMGKTAFVLSMARNIAVDYQRAVAVFSLEMSGVQLVQRLIASESGFNSDKLRKGQLTNSEQVELNHRIAKLQNAQIYIDDTPALSVFELRAKCRRLKASAGIQLVIIDYLPSSKQT